MTDEELIKILDAHSHRLIAALDVTGAPFYGINLVRLSAERHDGVERKIILWLDPYELNDCWQPVHGGPMTQPDREELSDDELAELQARLNESGPTFRLRIWQEQVLFDCNDYLVTADNLADAVALLQRVQEQADDQRDDVEHDNISRIVARSSINKAVVPLDPAECVAANEGVTLISADGERLRDIVGVPSNV
jgi:hypothetical protein